MSNGEEKGDILFTGDMGKALFMKNDGKSCVGDLCAHHKLTKSTEENNKDKDAGSVIYICPMHLEIRRLGPGACPICGMSLEPETITNAHEELRSDFKRRLWISLFLTVPLFALTMVSHLLEFFGIDDGGSFLDERYSPYIQWFLSTPVIFWAGNIFFKRAFSSALQGHLNMFTLVSLGVGAAYGYSVCVLVLNALSISWPGAGLYFEPAAGIICLVLLGQWIEEIGREKANKAILHLLDLSPEYGYLVEGSDLKKVLLSHIKIGDILRVRPGERVPVDGVIIEGSGYLNESMMTGEAFPVKKIEANRVIGGTLNGDDSFTMRATHVGDETLLAHIIGLVVTAQRTKAPIQKLVDKVASHFVPFVIAISFFTAMTWIVLGEEAYALTSAVAVLIIACPCALGLATPLSIVMATARGARTGIITRRAEDLERLSGVDTIIFDKTGTLTEGKPVLHEVVKVSTYGEKTLLALAASLETHSGHPLGKAIVEAAQTRSLAFKDLKNVHPLASKGLSAFWGKKAILLGSSELMGEEGVDMSSVLSHVEFLRQKGQTVIFMSMDKKLVALFVLSDPLKAYAKDVVQTLFHQKKRVILLTGDHESTAMGIANRVGINHVEASVLPERKFQVIKDLQEKGHKVAMIGDGVNDAPALMQADVGIAMGTGADAAMESAGITLISGDLRMFLKAQILSRKTMRNIWQNLAFAFGYNVLSIPIAAGAFYAVSGIILEPMVASAAMALSSVSVIWNAYRLKNANLDLTPFAQTSYEPDYEEHERLGTLLEN